MYKPTEKEAEVSNNQNQGHQKSGHKAQQGGGQGGTHKPGQQSMQEPGPGKQQGDTGGNHTPAKRGSANKASHGASRHDSQHDRGAQPKQPGSH